ncbi:hypothetical protein [Huintestinicola sp.]|uniref:hypothetical protein n=1 Tax=Huintestinicola sp. TaxID=2981661 RepID=UPI003D7DF19B
MQTADIERMIKRTKNLNMGVIEANPPPTFSEYVLSLLEEKGVKRSRLILALNMDRNYGYQILNGTRIPTRQQIIHMALFLGLDVAQTQKLLTLGKREALYVRRPEDAKIVHCLEHKMSYEKACEFIWENE